MTGLLREKGEHPKVRVGKEYSDEPVDSRALSRTISLMREAQMPRKNDLNIPILVEALRSTFQRLEASEEAMPNDPALREIKSSILRTMANREEVETFSDTLQEVEQ